MFELKMNYICPYACNKRSV